MHVKILIAGNTRHLHVPLCIYTHHVTMNLTSVCSHTDVVLSNNNKCTYTDIYRSLDPLSSIAISISVYHCIPTLDVASYIITTQHLLG